jgi:hypothetical protein
VVPVGGTAARFLCMAERRGASVVGVANDLERLYKTGT